jgi:putative transposase
MKENEMNLNFAKFDELLDEAMKERQMPLDENALTGLMKQMMKRTVERMLQGEMTHHLGYGKHEAVGRGTGNSRNGTSTKKLQSELGEVTIAVPRDRRGDFEPQVVGKHQTRFTGFDEKIISK